MDATPEEFMKRYDEIISKARQIARDKTKLYGTKSICELGSKGEFVQIHRKYTRLKKMIWENEKNSAIESKYHDTLKDTLLDMINYCVITLIAIEDE